MSQLLYEAARVRNADLHREAEAMRRVALARAHGHTTTRRRSLRRRLGRLSLFQRVQPEPVPSLPASRPGR